MMDAGTAKQFLEYIRNAGGAVSIPIFDDDWEPVGQKLRQELEALGLINVRGSVITLTEAGEKAIGS